MEGDVRVETAGPGNKEFTGMESYWTWRARIQLERQRWWPGLDIPEVSTGCAI